MLYDYVNFSYVYFRLKLEDLSSEFSDVTIENVYTYIETRNRKLKKENEKLYNNNLTLLSEPKDTQNIINHYENFLTKNT